MFLVQLLFLFIAAGITSTEGAESSCDDIVENENCDGRYGLMVWYDDVADGADCQFRCNELDGAEFFNFYNEEVMPGWFIGYCACLTECVAPSSDGCTLCVAKQDAAENTPERESTYCNCMRGPMEPSVASCE